VVTQLIDPASGVQNTITTPEGVWTYDTTTGVGDIRPSAKLQWVATLPYTLCDAEIPVLCDPANITFTVTAVNDAPIVDNDKTLQQKTIQQ
jgi:hypothetical protein